MKTNIYAIIINGQNYKIVQMVLCPKNTILRSVANIDIKELCIKVGKWNKSN